MREREIDRQTGRDKEGGKVREKQIEKEMVKKKRNMLNLRKKL